MNLENYYYHTILLNAKEEKEICQHLEAILKDGALKSKKLRSKKENDILSTFKTTTTYNGDDFLSFASYMKKTDYKVTPLDEASYRKSKLSQVFPDYKEYTEYLKLDEELEKPISKEVFFETHHTKNKREYFDYLDTITRKYPVDCAYLYDKSKDPIYTSIQKLVNDSIVYCYKSEYAFDIAVLESQSITFLFPKSIPVYPTQIIPNLPFEIENTIYQKNPEWKKKHSNLLGEIQVKNQIAISKAVGILVKKNLNSSKIRQILQKYSYFIPIYTISKDGKKLIESSAENENK